MAPDLLSTIRSEIDERLRELRPLLAEYERLRVAADALATSDTLSGSDTVVRTPATPAPAASVTRPKRALRGSAAGAIERSVAVAPAKPAAPTQLRTPPAPPPRVVIVKSNKERLERAARDAILAALGHGSHTIGELAVVTAMSGPNIIGNMRRLVADGAVVKTEREGRIAWALASA